MDIDKLAVELERDEGLRLRPYKDTVGKLTVGIGRNLDDVGISEDEARQMLHNDILRSLKDVEKLDWYQSLDPVRQRAIANMSFNLGIGRLLGFRKMIKAIKAQDWAEAAVQALDSKWATQVGARADRLADMLEHGDSE